MEAEAFEPQRRTASLAQEALARLSSLGAVASAEELPSLLQAVQEVCNALVGLAKGDGGEVAPEFLESALAALGRGLGAVREHLSKAVAGAALAALCDASGWSAAFLQLLDTALCDSQWHLTLQLRAPDYASHKRVQDAVAEVLKDKYTPLLCDAAAQLTAAAGFRLHREYQLMLGIGHGVADIVSYRDARMADPALLCMRQYSTVNAVWSSITRMWIAVPAELKPQLEEHDLGVRDLLSRLVGYIGSDAGMVVARLSAPDLKLCLFWQNQANRLLAREPPEAAAFCWPLMLRCLGEVRRQLAAAAASPDPQAAAVVAQADKERLSYRLAKTLLWCVNKCGHPQELRVCVDGLRMQLSDGSSPGRRERALDALHTACDLLLHAPDMTAAVRAACLPLVEAVLGALGQGAFHAALESALLRQRVAASLLAFLAACCIKAGTGAAGQEPSSQDREQHTATWAKCQQLLFGAAIQPHPVVGEVLGSLWGDLAAASDSALLRSHLNALHELLCAVAAAEAAAGYAPPSPLQAQLVQLLARVLGGAPAGLREAYARNFVKVFPGSRGDGCHLAGVAAELRAAALVDAAAGTPACGPSALAVLGEACSLLGPAAEAALAQLALGAAPEGACCYVAWVLEAARTAVAYLAALGGAAQAEPAQLHSLAEGAIQLLIQTAAEQGGFACAAPALGLLRSLHQLGTGLPTPPQLAALLPALLACQQRCELSAAVAALATAFKHCAEPHAALFHALLAEREPLLQHAALEAYADYLQGCPAAHLRASIPPSACEPGADPPVMAAPFKALLEPYLRRGGGTADLQPQQLCSGEGAASAWAPVLQDVSNTAAVRARQAAEAGRLSAAEAVASPPENAAAAKGGVPPAAAVGAAVQAVARSIKQLEKVAAQAGGLAGALDEHGAQLLQVCSARLGQLAAGQ